MRHPRENSSRGAKKFSAATYATGLTLVDAVRNEDSTARVKLAARILIQRRCGGGPPILLSEIAELRFLAESDEEREMPIEELAQVVIERERKRMGFPPPDHGLPNLGRN